MTDSSFKFDATMFRVAAMFISTEETRYYLRGVFVTPHPVSGVFLVATNGHVMAVLHDKNGRAPRGAILSADFKSKALKPARGESRRWLTLDPGEKNIATGFADVRAMGLGYSDAPACKEAPALVDKLAVSEIDGTFPDWRRVPPRLDDTKPAPLATSYASRYVKLLADAALAISDDRNPALRIFANSASSGPAAVHVSGAPHAVFVIIPYRWKTDTPALPDWLTANPSDTAAQAAE